MIFLVGSGILLVILACLLDGVKKLNIIGNIIFCIGSALFIVAIMWKIGTVIGALVFAVMSLGTISFVIHGLLFFDLIWYKDWLDILADSLGVIAVIIILVLVFGFHWRPI